MSLRLGNRYPNFCRCMRIIMIISATAQTTLASSAAYAVIFKGTFDTYNLQFGRMAFEKW
jgi:hypothetical protein